MPGDTKRTTTTQTSATKAEKAFSQGSQKTLFAPSIDGTLTSPSDTEPTTTPKMDKTSPSTVLTPDMIRPIGPETISYSNTRHLKLPKKTRLKYNSATVKSFKLKEEFIPPLIKQYHDVKGLPTFTHRLLKGRPCVGTALFMEYDKMYEFIDAKWDNTKTLLCPNPGYINIEEFNKQCTAQGLDHTLRNLKNQLEGLALITWFLHPLSQPEDIREIPAEKTKDILHQRIKKELSDGELTDSSQRFNYYRTGKLSSKGLAPQKSWSKLPRSESQNEISVLESKSSVPYLACIFDLDIDKKRSLDYLKKLRATILQMLETIYGVTPDDTIKIYMHMPYLEVTTTLHIHVRVNQASHAVEESKSFGINEIINILEQGKSVTELVLARDEILCSSYPMAEGINGFFVKTVTNPKRDWRDILTSLEVSDAVKEYLSLSIKDEDIRAKLSRIEIDQIEKLAKTIFKIIESRPDTSDISKVIQKKELLLMINGLDTCSSLQLG